MSRLCTHVGCNHLSLRCNEKCKATTEAPEASKPVRTKHIPQVLNTYKHIPASKTTSLKSSPQKSERLERREARPSWLKDTDELRVDDGRVTEEEGGRKERRRQMLNNEGCVGSNRKAEG